MKKLKELDFGKFSRRNMPWIIFFVIVVIFSIISPNFLSINNIVNILSQNAYVIMASLGIAFIMISGEFDLSVGYQMSIIGIVAGIMLTELHWPSGIVIVLCIALGVFLNLINAVLSMKLKLPLIMVTVGTMTIFQGISFTISGAVTYSGFPNSFKFMGQGSICGIPFTILFTLVMLLVMSFFLNRTYSGRYVYALGGNKEAARLAGINVNGVRLMIAVIAGIFIALSTLMLIAKLGSAQSMIGPGTEFTVITGVLLGGVSIRGGEGKLSGVVAGILIMAILSNGMMLANMGTYAQYIAKGAIMLTAIGIDVYQFNRRESSKRAASKASDSGENPKQA